MHNKDGRLRRCLFCGNAFTPIHAGSSFCCYGHYQMYMRGDVHIPEEALQFEMVVSDTQHPFPRPKPPSFMAKPGKKGDT